jgi:hypothetical protein
MYPNSRGAHQRTPSAKTGCLIEEWLCELAFWTWILFVFSSLELLDPYGLSDEEPLLPVLDLKVGWLLLLHRSRTVWAPPSLLGRDHRHPDEGQPADQRDAHRAAHEGRGAGAPPAAGHRLCVPDVQPALHDDGHRERPGRRFLPHLHLLICICVIGPLHSGANGIRISPGWSAYSQEECFP